MGRRNGDPISRDLVCASCGSSGIYSMSSRNAYLGASANWKGGVMEACLSDILSFIFGGFAGSLVTLYVKKQRASGQGNVVDQSKSRAGGDVVGRDKVTK